MSKVRGQRVASGARRAQADAENSRTVVATFRASAPAIDFRRLFLAHYERIRAVCMEFAEPGLAVVSIDLRGRWEGSMCLASRAGELRTGVVGRHSEADLFIGDDPTIALRHLLFVVEPPRSLQSALRGEVRFRVLDLNTGNPPIDEDGRAVESLTAEGPIFLACQDHAIMAFVTGDPTDWPESARDAWACIPARVFVEERLAPTAEGSKRSRLPGARRMPIEIGRITLVRRHEGPVHVVDRRMSEDDSAHGILMIQSGEKTEVLRVGRESLRRGLLVGRYDRCQASERNAIEDVNVSRVHLMVVEIVGQPFAIDLASSNGSYRAVKHSTELVRFQSTQMEEGVVVALGSTDSCIGWAAAAPNDHDEDGDSLPIAAAVPRVVVKPAGVARRRRRSDSGPPAAQANNRAANRAASPARHGLTPAEFLRQLPRYLKASLLERLAWESYYIPLAVALVDRGGSATLEEAATLVSFPAGHLALMARALQGDDLGIFDPDWSARVSLLPAIHAVLKMLRKGVP
jgi:hypothetical protein